MTGDIKQNHTPWLKNAKRPFYKDPLVIVLISVLILGGVGTTIRLVCHFRKIFIQLN